MADSNLQPLLSENNNNADIYNVNITDKTPANRTIFDNRGKYFDMYQYNKDFDNYIAEQEKKRLTSQEYKLKDINEVENSAPQAYKLPLNKILTNTQIMWFDIFSNGFENFTNDYFFYISITFIFIFILYCFIVIIIDV